MTDPGTPYPLRVDGALAPSLSRGLWLVKWLLLIPHLVVLAFLWLAFVVVTVVAFVAILATARYPRSLFDFNVGVLRWTWRVHHYGYAALGTDRYPPFTLADVPDYPAHLDVAYPERLSRGLVLVKWWLLALPHYLVLAIFVGGGVWLWPGDRRDSAWDDGWGAGGLVALLVLVAGVVLLFTGRYPRPIYDFVLGMDRWALRVAAYAGLMTDRYPPFRLDPGGPDPGAVPIGPPTPPPAPSAAVPAAGSVGAGESRPGGWTGGRVVAVVTGAVLLFVATGLLVGGGALLWADRTQRDGDHLWTARTEISSSRYAITSEGIALDAQGAEWVVDDVLGEARLEVIPEDGDAELFLGVAETRDVEGYLGSVGHHRLVELGPGWDRGRVHAGMMTEIPGGPPPMPPGDVDIWVAETSGTGSQVLDWRPDVGNWTVVVMRADGGAGIDASARLGVTAPGLVWLAVGLLGVGALLAGIGALLVVVAAHEAQRPVPSGPAAGVPTPRAPVAGPVNGRALAPHDRT